MTIQTLPDIVGSGAKVAISTQQGLKCRRLFLTGFRISLGAAARFGDTNVGAARGVILSNATVVTISASDEDPTDLLDLTAAFAYVPAGVTLKVSFAQ